MDEMFDELRAVIEKHSSKIVDEYLAEAFEGGSGTYLYATRRSPFEVALHVDERNKDVATLDLRKDLLEVFEDDPEEWKDKIIECEKAFRAFADELAALARKENAA